MGSEILNLTIELDQLLRVIQNNLHSMKDQDEVLMAIGRTRLAQDKLRRLTGRGVNTCSACGRPFK
jgi:hypothetical protein